MRLLVLVPTEVMVDETVTKVVAEAEDGLFCLLPRHVDFVAALVPGILSFTDREGRENLVAVDTGCLVKCANRVVVSTFNAVASPRLERLKATIEERFGRLDDQERAARSALARLEAGTIRRFLELKEERGG